MLQGLMDKVKTFENAEFGAIRATTINGIAYFVGVDITAILGYANPRRAILNYTEPEDKLYDTTLPISGERGYWLINEKGVYSLIRSGFFPKAKQFRNWITSEVLPSLYEKEEEVETLNYPRC